MDSPQTRSDLVDDYEMALSLGIPEEFANPFYCVRSCMGVLTEDSEEEIVDPNYDLCLKVDDHTFYCNKVLSSFFLSLQRMNSANKQITPVFFAIFM